MMTGEDRTVQTLVTTTLKNGFTLDILNIKRFQFFCVTPNRGHILSSMFCNPRHKLLTSALSYAKYKLLKVLETVFLSDRLLLGMDISEN